MLQVIHTLLDEFTENGCTKDCPVQSRRRPNGHSDRCRNFKNALHTVSYEWERKKARAGLPNNLPADHPDQR